jgi:hypothetical protein
LVKLGHIAIDGTKIQGNASKRKAMSHERMVEMDTSQDGLPHHHRNLVIVTI